MSVTVSLLPVIAESVRQGAYSRIGDWLDGLGAKALETVMVDYSRPPILSTQGAHGFEWGGKYGGWVDILRSDDDIVQVVSRLRYPRRRWFSRHRRDWNTVIAEAEALLGPGKAFHIGDKQGQMFRQGDTSALICTYCHRKNAYIEIKMARGGFCS